MGGSAHGPWQDGDWRGERRAGDTPPDGNSDDSTAEPGGGQWSNGRRTSDGSGCTWQPWRRPWWGHTWYGRWDGYEGWDRSWRYRGAGWNDTTSWTSTTTRTTPTVASGEPTTSSMSDPGTATITPPSMLPTTRFSGATTELGRKGEYGGTEARGGGPSEKIVVPVFRGEAEEANSAPRRGAT